MPLLPQLERELAKAEERLRSRRSGRSWRLSGRIAPARAPSVGAVMLACSAIVAVAIAAFAITVLGHTHRSAASSHRSPVTSSVPAPGAPETLLVIASDHRPGEPYRTSNTDTILLVRIDAGSSTTNVLSIPRNLAVELPDGNGTTSRQKLNAAYSIGGANLVVQTLKQQVLPGLVINHVLDVNLAGFTDLINAIGCVYTDVDHRYFNSTAGTDYSGIDLQAGYQKLCGAAALSFLRYRHTDSDVVGDARQLDFIRWVEDGYSAAQLLENRDKLLRIFGMHVQTDPALHTIAGLIDFFNAFAFAYAHTTLKSIPFPAFFRPCGNGSAPCFVSSRPTADRLAYQALMTPTVRTSGGSPTPMPTTVSSDAGLSADARDGRSQAAELGSVGMPVLYPALISSESTYCSSITAACDESGQPRSAYADAYPRKYTIAGTNGSSYDAYVFTLAINPALGEYYTVQGTTWQHPPILSHPTAVTMVHGKRLYEYVDGSHVTLVAFHTPHGAYWIANTLTDEISNAQMVAMAASL